LIKPESGKTETVAKGGEATHRRRIPRTPNSRRSLRPTGDGSAIKPKQAPDHSGDTSQQHEKAASETISTDTEATRHTAKGTTQSEHRAAAPARNCFSRPIPRWCNPPADFSNSRSRPTLPT
jgi:chemotaxis protein MotD